MSVTDGTFAANGVTSVSGLTSVSGGVLSTGNTNGFTTDSLTLATGTFNANASTTATTSAVINSGIFNANNEFTTASLTLNGGSLNVTGNNLLNVSNFTGNGGRLNLTTNAIEGQTLATTSLNMTNNVSMSVDAGLDTQVSDNLSASGTISGTSKVIIDAINLLSDSTNKYSKTLVAGTSNLIDYINISTDSSGNYNGTITKASGVTGDYAVKYDNGYLVFRNTAFDENLVSVVRDATLTTYELKHVGDHDEDVAAEILAYGETGDPDKIGPMTGTTLTIDGTTNRYGINGNSKGGIEVGNGKTLTFTNVGDVYGFDGAAVTNSGTLNVENSKFTNGITNTNALNFTGTNTIASVSGSNGATTIESGKTTFGNTLSQKSFINKGTADISASNLQITDGADNRGVLNLSNGNLASNITTTTTTGTTNIKGAVTNNNDKTITQNSVTIDGGASLTTKADKVVSTTAIDNSGILNLNAGELASAITGVGTTNIKEDVTSGKTISQNTVTVAANKTLTSSANVTVNNTLTNNGTIANTSEIVINGDTSNAGIINGTGTLTLNNDFTNAGTISQKELTLANGITLTNNAEKSLTVTDNLTNDGTIQNKGTFNLSGNNSLGLITDATTASGILNLTGEITADKNVTQKEINVNSGTLENNAVITANSINNKGKITSTLDNLIGSVVNKTNGSELEVSGTSAGTISTASGVTDSRLTLTGDTTLGHNVSVTDTNLTNGTLKLNNGMTYSTDRFVVSATNAALDLRTGANESRNLGEITLTNGMNLAIDANLSSTASSDTLNGSISSSSPSATKITLNNVTVNGDSNYKHTFTTLTTTLNDRITGSGTAASASGVTGTYDYIYGNGKIDFSKQGMDNLVIAVRDKEAGYSFSGTEDIANGIDTYTNLNNDTTKVGTMGADLTINGNGTGTINGGNRGGIINPDKTLTIKNVSDINNFSGDAVTNSGTLNVENTKFTSGITNTNALNFTGTNTINGTVVGTDGTTTVTSGTTTFGNTVTHAKAAIGANNIVITNGVNNLGILDLGAGTNLASNISGNSGTTNIIGNVASAKTITQKVLTTSNGITFTNTGDITVHSTLTNNGIIDNSGLMVIGTATGSVTGGNLGKITDTNSTGSLIINGGTGVTYTNNSTDGITQNTFTNNATLNNNNKLTANITNTGKITSNADNLVGIVANSGELNLTGGSVQDNITKNGSNGGTVKISNTVTLGSDKAISGNDIELVSGSTLKLHGGSIADAASLIAKSNSILDMQDSSVSSDYINISNVDLSSSDLKITIDADLANEKADKISANSVTGTNHIVISAINILSDAVSAVPTVVDVADNVTRTHVQLGSFASNPVTGINDSYLVTYDDGTSELRTTGQLTFGFANLENAVKSQAQQKTYVMAADEVVTGGLVPFNGSTLTINANGHSITGSAPAPAGLTVGNNQTLNLSDASDVSGFSGGTFLTNNGEANITSSTISDAIINNSELNLNGTNTIADISGASGTTAVQTGKTIFNGDVTQDSILVDKLAGVTAAEAEFNGDVNADLTNKGKTTLSNATTLTGDVYNSGTLTNHGTISSDEITNTGNLENTNGTISATTITNNGENGVITTSADKITATDKITNNAQLNLTGGDNSNVIDGSGNTKFSGTTVNNGSVSQNIIEVTNTGDVTTNADNLIATDTTDGVKNAGNLTLTGGTNGNTITGTGDTLISGNVINNGTITQDTLTIEGTSAKLTTSADDVTAAIVNNKDLELTGGTIATAISGDGDLTISGNTSNTSSISQGSLTVDSGKTFTNNASTGNPVTIADTLTNNGTIANNGTMSIGSGNPTGGDLGTINGTGTLELNGGNNVTYNNNSTSGITQGTVINNANLQNDNDLIATVTNNGSITSNADNLKGVVTNATNANVTLTGGSTSKDILGNGKVTVQNEVTLNNTTANNSIELSDGSTLKIRNNADISNNNSLVAKGGTIDLADGIIGGTAINLGNVDITNSDLNVIIDTDLSTDPTAISDIITANSVSGSDNKVLISDINLMHKSSHGVPVDVQIAQGAIISSVDLAAGIKTHGKSAEGESYMLSYDNTTGNLNFNFNGLYQAVKSPSSSRVYSMADDEYVIQDLGDMGGPTTGANKGTLTINGNHYSINGNNHEGINVGADQTLYVNEVGKLAEDGSVEKSYNGFEKAIDVASGGKLTVENSVFDGNTTDVNNNGTFTLKGTNTFNDTIASTNNTGTMTVNNGTSTFNGEVTQNSITVNDGATANFNNNVNSNVANSGTTNNAGTLTGNVSNTGDNAEFNNNGKVNGNITDNSGTFNNKGGKVTGNVSTSGTFDNSNNGLVTGNVDITDGTFNNEVGRVVGNVTNAGTLDTNLNNISGTIANNGTMNVSGGTVQNDITGTGTANIKGDITNTKNVTQGTVNVNSNKNITNTGSLTVNDALDNKGNITGTGVLNIGDNATADNTNGTVLQNSINIGDGASVKTNADKFNALNGINNNGTITYTGGRVRDNITGSTNGIVNLGDDPTSSDNVDMPLNSKISGNQINLNNALITFGPNADISGASSLNINAGGMDVMDGKLTSTNLGNVNLNGKSDLAIDFNLSDMTSDTFVANVTNNGGMFNINKLNIMGTTLKDNIKIQLGNPTRLGASNVTSDTFDLPSIMTPIRKINGRVEDGYLIYTPGGNKPSDFNPAALATPIAAQFGGYLSQINSYDEAFRNLDMKMLMTQEERNAWKLQNRYASADSVQVFSPLYLPEKDKALWARPYAAFEHVGLNNGPNVNNTMYGTFFGGDSDMKELRHGWDYQWSAYVGYNGSHQSYSGVDIYQNGGNLGVTGAWFKGNFFTALTANVGASIADESTMYGSDVVPMIMGGVASKTGYNIQLAKGKFIIQPNYLMSYTFVQSMNYKSASGAHINGKALNGIQIAPGIKFIGNLKGGWQPYASVRMVWNTIDKTRYTAEDIALPQMSVAPYLQYGLGLQKRWGDRFTGFFQAMARSGGRNGVAMSAGFRWAIGKDYHDYPQDYKDRIPTSSGNVSAPKQAPAVKSTTEVKPSVQKQIKDVQPVKKTVEKQQPKVQQTVVPVVVPAVQKQVKEVKKQEVKEIKEVKPVAEKLQKPVSVQELKQQDVRPVAQKVEKQQSKVTETKKEGFFGGLFKGMDAPESVKRTETKNGKSVIKGLTDNEKQHLEYTTRTKMQAVIDKL